MATKSGKTDRYAAALVIALLASLGIAIAALTHALARIQVLA
jgi:hypothetical protein